MASSPGSLAVMALLNDSETKLALEGLDGWQVGDGALVREWKFEDFARALDFVQRVGALAEQANHHPDILLHGWNKVRLTLSTHSEGGVTQADFGLAEQIDGLL
jgi:4a-hydroxytetrahydrobiopterin dehydratase